MGTTQPGDAKAAALRRHHALNLRPDVVADPAFTAGNPFFDARDLVQVKYEMLRRVFHEEHSVTDAARAFGFSRPSYYQTQAAFTRGGLPGLLPQRPGPRRAHKLSEAAMAVLETALGEDPGLRAAQLVSLLQERLGILVHPRSVERALARHSKKGRQSP
jgi:transposase